MYKILFSVIFIFVIVLLTIVTIYKDIPMQEYGKDHRFLF